MIRIASALFFGCHFRRYGESKIVKRFTMTPWTRALSHTLAEGDFHTDLNTVDCPPSVTAIQCILPDPTRGAGVLRVARIVDVITALKEQCATGTLRFLTELDVTMVSESQRGEWRGRIFDGRSVRFHPATLRAATRRLSANPEDLETHLTAIKREALRVSSSAELDAGDILFVSNKLALHYRSACTVKFRSFPQSFESRSIHVLHLMDEPA